MEHYIIVKFNNKIDFKKSIDPIVKLFEKSLGIEGVDKVEVYTSCIDLDNRYDIMIKMKVTQEGLKNFDNSSIHREWKEQYGKFIINKAIFDCEI